jgi:hypothetical protein
MTLNVWNAARLQRYLSGAVTRHLAEGRQVTVRVSFGDGKPKYELKIDK